MKYNRIGCILPVSQGIITDDIDPKALTGAGHGVSSCILPPSFNQSGFLVTIAYFIVCAPIGATVGAIQGTYKSSQLKSLKEDHGTLQARLNLKSLNQKMQQVAIDYAQENQLNLEYIRPEPILFNDDNTTNYAYLASKGIDTVIEFDVNNVLLDETGMSDLPIFLTLNINSKLVRTSDGSVLNQIDEKIRTRKYPYQEWIKNDFQLLQRELNEILEAIVTATIDEYLLVYYPTLSEELAALNKSVKQSEENSLDTGQAENRNRKSKLPQRHAPYYVLEPYSPEPTFRMGDIREMFSEKYEYPVMGSFQQFSLLNEQQPMFKWEKFPWEHDQISQESFIDIVYDLEVYDYSDGSLIYLRRSLKTNQHKMEIELNSNKKYLWTVRARFKLDGQSRATEWGGFYSWHHPAWTFLQTSDDWNIPDWSFQKKRYFYYPFIVIEE